MAATVKRRWRRQLSAKETNRIKKKAREEARPYATGEKKQPWWKPGESKRRGTPHMPAKEGAAFEYRYHTGKLRDTSGHAQAEKHYNSKTTVKGRKKTSTGGRWTLRKANVTRAADGTFKKRRRGK